MRHCKKLESCVWIADCRCGHHGLPQALAPCPGFRFCASCSGAMRNRPDSGQTECRLSQLTLVAGSNLLPEKVSDSSSPKFFLGILLSEFRFTVFIPGAVEWIHKFFTASCSSFPSRKRNIEANAPEAEV